MFHVQSICIYIYIYPVVFYCLTMVIIIYQPYIWFLYSFTIFSPSTINMDFSFVPFLRLTVSAGRRNSRPWSMTCGPSRPAHRIESHSPPPGRSRSKQVDRSTQVDRSMGRGWFRGEAENLTNWASKLRHFRGIWGNMKNTR